MMTYAEIQEKAGSILGVEPATVRSCWVAEVKRERGLTRRRAPNAGEGEGAPPCPDRYRKAIGRFLPKGRKGRR
jgi:hypothetical protein